MSVVKKPQQCNNRTNSRPWVRFWLTTETGSDSHTPVIEDTLTTSLIDFRVLIDTGVLVRVTQHLRFLDQLSEQSWKQLRSALML